MPSLCSLRKRVQETGKGQFRVDGDEDVRRFMKIQAKQMEFVMDFRSRADADPSLLHGCTLVDVKFPELAADPAKVVEHVYEVAGLAMSQKTRDDLHAYIGESRKVLKKNKHKYSLSDFGIDPEKVETKFEAYHERFGV